MEDKLLVIRWGAAGKGVNEGFEISRYTESETQRKPEVPASPRLACVINCTPLSALSF